MRVRMIAAGAALVAVAATLPVVLTSGAGTGTRTGGRLAGQRLAYHDLPGRCQLLSARALAAYLPDAITTTLQPPGASSSSTTSCSWTSISGHQNRELVTGVDLYDGAEGVTLARRGFGDAISEFRSSGGTGVTVTAHPVAGVGDQAESVGDNAARAADPQLPATLTLEVRSSNALVTIDYSDTPISSLYTPSGGQDTAGLAAEIALARDVLTVLARPATGAPVTLATPGDPRYGVPPHACRLIPAATLNAYVPDATASTGTPGTPVMGTSDCLWETASDAPAVLATQLQLQVSVYGSGVGLLGPQAAYETDVEEQNQSGGGTTVLRIQPVTGLAGQATAIYVSGLASQGVTLLAWSGDAVLQLTYEFSPLPGFSPPPPSRGAQLAAVTTLARAVLAALPVTPSPGTPSPGTPSPGTPAGPATPSPSPSDQAVLLAAMATVMPSTPDGWSAAANRTVSARAATRSGSAIRASRSRAA
jgi:hypothetical protein